ncbi:MAG TPA: MlaD family protein [Gemmataceae bacterium]|nr:MlaD family protein [Gemmataceae bacterium]
MDLKKQRFRLGLFVAAATILLCVLILMFGGSAGRLFVGQNTYVIPFNNAPGVNKGTPVRRSGVKIGAVTKVELDDKTGKVLVTIAVDKKYTVWNTDVAVISQDLLSRDVTIDLENQPATPRLAAPQPVPAPKTDVKQVGGIDVGGDQFAAGQPPPGPPEPAPGQPLPPGSTIPGRSPGGPSSALESFQTVVPALEQALNAIRRSAERLEQAIPELDAGAREFTALGRSIREAVPEIRRTNDEIQALLRNFRNAGPGIQRTNEELQVAIRNFGSVAERIDVFMAANQDRIARAVDQTTDVLQRMSNVLSDENQRTLTSALHNSDDLLKESAKTNRQLQGTIATADRALRNFDVAAERLARVIGTVGDALAPLAQGGGGGTIQRFFTDPSLYNNLNQAACQISNIMPRLDRILRDAEVFADKIARHPESLGVGGAVRPSAGLKEAPSTNPTYRQQYP